MLRSKPLSMALLLLVCVSTSGSISAGLPYQIIDVPADSTVDAFFEINLKGYVALSIRDRNGPACVNLWWITWPLGRIKDIGARCNRAKLDIPGWLDLAISSKLRARSGAEPLKLVVAENAETANTVTVTFP